MSHDPQPTISPDLFAQLAATDPFQRRARRLFERGQVLAVNGNQADVRVGCDAHGNPLDLKEVPLISGYVPRVGDWVAIQYEAGHSGAPWITGPSMAADDSQDSAGIGVFSVSSAAPSDPQKSTIYFDESRNVWCGWDGSDWVDLSAKLHNLLPDLQGGQASEYYHLTAAEYAGTWLHQLTAVTSAQCPLEGVRSTAETATAQSCVLAKHQTTADMADGFGAGLALAIEDSAGVENFIGAMYALRDGADNTGKLSFQLASAGALAERMSLTAAGRLVLGSGTALRKLNVYEASGVVTALFQGSGAVPQGPAATVDIKAAGGADANVLLRFQNTISGGGWETGLNAAAAAPLTNAFCWSYSQGMNFAALRMSLSPAGVLNVTGSYQVAGLQVVGPQQSAVANIADTSGGANDGAARAKINTILAALRAHGLIAT